MLRSMYSGISGLKNHQTKLDVIGNNISNVNTYGFKKGRVVFKDLISQTTAGASAPTATRGGVNPKQVGLGSQLAAIDTIHGTGALQTTSRTLDLAISGDGFFQVADGANNLNGFSNIQYTRAGNFYMDERGYLVNGDGKYLVGYAATVIPTPTDIPTLHTDSNKVPNDQAGANYLLDVNTNPNTPTRVIYPAAAAPHESLRIIGNELVTGAKPGTPIELDNGGVKYNLKLDQVTGSYYITDASNNVIKLEVSGDDFIDNSTNPATTYTLGSAAALDTAIRSAIEINTVIVNNYEDTGATLRPIVIPTTAQSMSIGQDGTVNFVDQYGNLQWAGQIELAKFPNTGGLEKVGNNYYQETSNSGAPVVGFATEMGIGSIESGFLEMSNVDLSEEFTEMIVAQRGFQANSRIITTSDQILEELVNLKR